GLDVTEATIMSSEQIATIAGFGNPRADLAAQILPYYRDFHLSHGGPDGIHVHDSTCISYLIAPQHYGVRHHPVRVDTGWSVGRGKTWPTTRHALAEGPWAGRRAVTILTEVNSDAVVALELERLAR
ncbi:MAG TPA: hypothetical protein DCR14_13910, partial [Acidimicrobiaceae bacterium]|nr:hypothetical protein [Acidimicrobiaceae bacterium]